MKFPIPQDWDGETWECFQVQWPKSQMWIGMLRGFMSYAILGRTWDESTGSIKAAQAVGWQILEANLDMQTCEGAPVPTPHETIQQIIACCLAGEEDEDMPCINLKDLIRIHEGVLQVLDNCCNWVDVGDLSNVLKPPDSTTPAEPVPGDLACRKAFVVVHYILDMIHAGCVAFGSNTWPAWFSVWAAQFIQFKLDFAQSHAWVYDWIEDGGYSSAGLFDADCTADMIKDIIADWAAQISGDSLAVTETEKTMLLSAMATRTSSPASNVLQGVTNLLGAAGLTWIAVDGEHEEAADCSRPVPPAPLPSDQWPTRDWRHIYTGWGAVQPADVIIVSGEGTWNTGGYIESAYSGAYRRTKPGLQVKAGYTSGGTLTEVAFLLKAAPTGGFYDANTMYASDDTLAAGAYPDPAPCSGAQTWWQTTCAKALVTSDSVYADFLGYITGHDGDNAYSYRCYGIIVQGTGTDPFTGT